MSCLILLYAISFVVLVKAHPLVQTIHQCPALQYQPSVYRPYAESIQVLQPSYNNPYSQQILIQNPISNDQHSQVPASLEQISHIYWDKLLSNPTLRNLIDPYNQYGKDATRTSLQPHSTGGVVNNYIILPPDYLRENATIFKTTPKTKRVKSKQKNKQTNQRNRKCNKENLKASKNKKKTKTKQITKQAWSFNTDNINCFTPLDVLENEKYEPVAKNRKVSTDLRQCDKVKIIPKLAEEFDGDSNLNKTKNKIKNKSKKKSKLNKIANGKNGECINKLPKPGEETKQLTSSKKMLNCMKTEEIPRCAEKISNDIGKVCELNLDERLLTNLLQQDCTDLENRRTRNSKSNASKKDFRYVYPNLQDDLSKSMTWYMNGMFSPSSYQQGSNTNFQRNMYPFDLSQIYQIPQHSKVNKFNGNKDNNNKNKRKKKKKKKTSNPKVIKENANSSDENSFQIQEIVNEIDTEINTNIQIIDTTQYPDLSTAFPEINTEYAGTNSKISDNVLISETSCRNSHNDFVISEINDNISETNTEIPEIPETCVQIPEISTQTSEPRTQIPAAILQTLYTTPNPIINTEVPEISTLMKPDEVISTNSSIIVIETTASPVTEKISTETVVTESKISMDELLKFLKHIIKLSNRDNAEDVRNLEKVDQNENKANITCKTEELGMFENTYKTEILESTKTTENNNDTVISDDTQTYLKETPLLFDLHRIDLAPEMGLDDETLDIFDYTLIKDYYPNFTADNFAYWLSGEETDIENIHDRYFYTTDKNIDSIVASSPEEKNDLYNERIMQNNIESKDIIDALKEKTIAGVENSKSNDVVFIMPPGLEVPDFITRKINMDKQDSTENYGHYESEGNYHRFIADNFADKSDNHVETSDKYQTNENKPESIVETVYAKSKVVKYGQAQEITEPIESELHLIPTVDGDITIFNDGEKTIVLAKSIPPEEFW